MKKITMLDTSISSSNIGDSIIMDAIKEHLFEIFPEGSFYTSFTHEYIGKTTKKLIKNSDFSFVCGTNLLSSNMRTQRQWKIGVKELFYLKNIILLGVGWKNYQNKITSYSKFYYNSILNKDILHSVRDSYTKNKLNEIGINNVINTGCPTMWKLTKEHCKDIPKEKANSVILTLTDYRKNIELDKKLINILKDNYSEVLFWPQGARDYDYANNLSLLKDKKVKLINPNLKSYNNILNNPTEKYDFIGTRLHGGIRALQKKHRTIIIGVDNRALEKKKDFNLNVIDRNNLNELNGIINSKLTTDITINEKNIVEWKEQFKTIN